MKAWTDWFGTLGGALVDGGNPTSQVRTIAANGSVSDGGTNPSSGYSIIKADSSTRRSTSRRAARCSGGASVEVAEIFAVM